MSLLLCRATIRPTANDKIVAADIVKSLGYLALAIEHAGAYVHSGGGGLRDYKEQFETNRRTTLQQSPAVSMHRDSVFETFTISFERIRKRNIDAAKLLTFFGFLDGDDIAESLILSSHEDIQVFKLLVVSDTSKYHAAVQELLSYSLIRIKLEGDIKSISLHLLVHYFSRARMTIEVQWRWTGHAVGWLLQSSVATNAYELYFPHFRKQLQQTTNLEKCPKDFPRRRRIWCYLGLLLQQYRHMWQNQGSMDELDKYAKTAMAVIEEDPNDMERLPVLAQIAVVKVLMQTIQFIDSSDTYDEILRRYLIKQMTPSAVMALQQSCNSATGTVPAMSTLALKVDPGKDDVSLRSDNMTNAINCEIVSGSIPLKGDTRETISQDTKTEFAELEDNETLFVEPELKIDPAIVTPSDLPTRSELHNSSPILSLAPPSLINPPSF